MKVLGRELTYRLKYTKTSVAFHTIVLEGYFFGLKFIDEIAANAFYAAVEEKMQHEKSLNKTISDNSDHKNLPSPSRSRVDRKPKINREDISLPSPGSFLHVGTLRPGSNGHRYEEVDDPNDIDPTLKRFLKVAGLSEDILKRPEEKATVEKFLIENNVIEMMQTFKNCMTPQPLYNVSMPSAHWYIDIDLKKQCKAMSGVSKCSKRNDGLPENVDLLVTKGRPPSPPTHGTPKTPVRPTAPPPPPPPRMHTQIAKKQKVSMLDEILSKGLLKENGLRHIERTTSNANTGSLLRVLHDALDAIKDANVSRNSSSDNESSDGGDWSE